MRSLLVPCGYLTIRAGQWTTEGKWQVMSQSDGMSLQSLLLRQQDPGHFGKSLGLCPPQKLGGTSGLSYSSPGHPWSQWSMPHQPGRITVLLCNHSRAASPSPDCLPGGKSKTESRTGRPHQVSERRLLFAGNRTPTSKWLKKQRSYFKIERSFWKTMLRYNSHSTKFIILRCTIQCFLVHSRKYAIITINKKSTIYLKNENSMYNLKNNHLPIIYFPIYLSVVYKFISRNNNWMLYASLCIRHWRYTQE